MSRSNTLWAACAAAVIMMSGCGEITAPVSDAGVDASQDPCSGDVALDDMWSCAVGALCGLLSECYGESFSAQQCENLNLGLFGTNSLYGESLFKNAIANGTMSYDGQRMGECMDDFRALTCIDLVTNNNALATCFPFLGTVGDGGSCFLQGECAVPGSICNAAFCDEGVCCEGTCLGPARVGEACQPRPCVAGAHCVDGTCTDGSIGDPCNDDWQCDPRYHCDGGTCERDRATGQACTSSNQCAATDACLGLGDGVEEGTCMRSLEEGDPCDGLCRSYLWNWCDQPDPSELGVCRRRRGVGEECDPQRGSCEPALRCEASVSQCLPAGGLGAACVRSGDCDFFSGLYCNNEITDTDNGVCEGRRDDGSVCTSNNHCISGYCRDGECTPLEGCY